MTLIFNYLKGILNIIMAYNLDKMIARDIYPNYKKMYGNSILKKYKETALKSIT